MSIMINLFLVLYLLSISLATIIGVIWFLTAILKLEQKAHKALLTKYHIDKSR
jgi:hypothetical protein